MNSDDNIDAVSYVLKVGDRVRKNKEWRDMYAYERFPDETILKKGVHGGFVRVYANDSLACIGCTPLSMLNYYTKIESKKIGGQYEKSKG